MENLNNEISLLTDGRFIIIITLIICTAICFVMNRLGCPKWIMSIPVLCGLYMISLCLVTISYVTADWSIYEGISDFSKGFSDLAWDEGEIVIITSIFIGLTMCTVTYKLTNGFQSKNWTLFIPTILSGVALLFSWIISPSIGSYGALSVSAYAFWIGITTCGHYREFYG